MSAQETRGIHPWGQPDESEFTAMERAKSPVVSAAELNALYEKCPQWYIQIHGTDLLYIRRLSDVDYRRCGRRGPDCSLHPQLFDPEHFDPMLEHIFGGKGAGSREAGLCCITVPCSKMAITQHDIEAVETAENYLVSSGIVPEPIQPTLTVVDQTT